MCDCITQADASMEEQKQGFQLALCMPYKQINGRMFIDCRTQVETVRVDDGNRKKKVPVMANYCPFCGVKYQTFEEMAAEQEVLDRFPMRETGIYAFYCRTCKGYDGFASATHGPALGLALTCQRQEEQGNEVRYEDAPTDHTNECTCHSETGGPQ